MKNTKTFFQKLDDNILKILTGVLIVIIPLYPKLPLAELLEGYIVRLRLEDILILVTFIIWFIQLYRKKIVFPNNKITKFILLYLAVGFLSTISAIFITGTVPNITSHILKIFFHLFRRVEYMSLYFIAYSAIRTRKDLILTIKIALITLAGVLVYGIGQKYLYWPAYSTMNREFSKGVKLYLQPNTRLFSTFAGHYDLAAYLMIMLSFLVPAFWVKNLRIWYKSIALFLLVLLSYWSLILTTSRTSFIGYFAAITVAAFLLTRYRSKLEVFKKWTLTVIVSMTLMIMFSDLTARFVQIIPNQDTRDRILAIQESINQPFVRMPEDGGQAGAIPKLLGFLYPPSSTPPPDPSGISKVATRSDTPPSTTKPTDLPPDVTEEEEQIRREVVESTGQEYTGSGYSPNALKYGLSLGIRLDALWPRAIEGFEANPLLGSGYSTLVKTFEDEFTYAESTDNDYLRMLGETGIFGAFFFLGIIAVALNYAYKIFKNSNQQSYRLISLGFISATIGLLINATYIDIFESSKIAYYFWIMVALVAIIYDKSKLNEK